jgi:4-amino-4-deoxychorismate lyase
VSRCRVNGRVADTVVALDRGLNYGDGLFETVRLVGGAPRFWPRHLARLTAGCERLGFACPAATLLEAEVQSVADVTPPDGIVKLVVTRGAGGRGYRPPATAEPTRIVTGHGAPAYDPAWTTGGIALRVCSTHLGRNPRLAGIKHLNRLEQVLARAEWTDDDVAEGLMLDASGLAICGTQSNLFLARDGVLATPRLDQCGVAGVMRGFVLECARSLGLGLEVRDVPLSEVEAAPELFVTNAVVGIWPVSAFAGHRLPVGPIAQRLQAALAAAVP